MKKCFCDKCGKEIPEYTHSIIEFQSWAPSQANLDTYRTVKALDLCDECFDRIKKAVIG